MPIMGLIFLRHATNWFYEAAPPAKRSLLLMTLNDD
jgi:hypothetical protein